jgi:hypothetical protein
MAGARNVYRHDYEDVAAKLVWDTVQLALAKENRTGLLKSSLTCATWHATARNDTDNPPQGAEAVF